MFRCSKHSQICRGSLPSCQLANSSGSQSCLGTPAAFRSTEGGDQALDTGNRRPKPDPLIALKQQITQEADAPLQGWLLLQLETQSPGVAQDKISNLVKADCLW